MASPDSISVRLRHNRLTRPLYRWLASAAVARAGTRGALNGFFDVLGADEKRRFYDIWHDILPARNDAFGDGEWRILIDGRELRWPLRGATLAKDWGLALAVLGHDAPVKETYLAALRSARPPGLFLDLGANFGTHSLMMATLGLRVIAFEPNLSCKAYFEPVARLNGFDIRWEAVAIGDEPGEVEISWPENAAWLGSLRSDYIRARPDEGAMVRQKTPVRLLDDYIDDIRDHEVLMKIDVEGYEEKVLDGARRVLLEVRPLVVFETNYGDERDGIHRRFAEAGYRIFTAPWSRGDNRPALSREAFAMSRDVNFVAAPEAST